MHDVLRCVHMYNEQKNNKKKTRIVRTNVKYSAKLRKERQTDKNHRNVYYKNKESIQPKQKAEQSLGCIHITTSILPLEMIALHI